MTDRDLLRLAAHEAAHAVLGMDHGRRVHRVTVRPGASYGAAVLWEPDSVERAVLTRELNTGRHPLNGLWPEAFRHGCRWVVEILAGDAAAEIVAPTTGYVPDRPLSPIEALRAATRPAPAPAPHSARLEAFETQPRDDERHDDEKHAERIAFAFVGYQTIGPFLGWMRAESRRACADRWPVIESVASALLAAETLDGPAVEALYNPARSRR